MPHNNNNNNYDDDNNACARILQFLLMASTATAIVLGIGAVYSCDFLSFDLPAGAAGTAPPLATITTAPVTAGQLLVNATTTADLAAASDGTEADPFTVTWGLFRYEDSREPNQCYSYNDASGPFPITETYWQFDMARWASCVSAGLASLAFMLLSMEICCCRFPCSRVVVNMSLLLSLLCVPPVFLIYTGGTCNIFSSTSYACELGKGSQRILIAMAFLLFALATSCATPKSTPLLRVIQERERNSVADPCCGCKGRTKEEIMEDNPEMLLAEMPQDEVQVPIGGGSGGGGMFGGKNTNTVGSTGSGGTYSFKHYMDDQAGGVTLQSQYKAASRRWLECEQNYETALDRFKQECLDASAAEQEEFSDAPSSIYAWRKVLKLPPRKIRDPELSRLVIVLKTLRNNSQQARRVMEQIETDLEEHIQPANEKIDLAMSTLYKPTTGVAERANRASVLREQRSIEDDQDDQDEFQDEAPKDQPPPPPPPPIPPPAVAAIQTLESDKDDEKEALSLAGGESGSVRGKSIPKWASSHMEEFASAEMTFANPESIEQDSPPLSEAGARAASPQHQDAGCPPIVPSMFAVPAYLNPFEKKTKET